MPSGPQGYDRYAYVNNSPVMHNDPTGHCPGLILLVCVGVGIAALTVIADQAVRSYVSQPYTDNKGENALELMQLAYQGEPSGEIVGSGLEDVASDHALLIEENELANELRSQPEYGNTAFASEETLNLGSVTFGEMGNNNMIEDAFHSQTWTLRAATVGVNYSVDESGNIALDYKATDTLDLLPCWGCPKRTGLSGFGYNVITTITGAYWHGILGASVMPTSAKWKKIIPAKDKKDDD